jgi:4-amino-4-deoxy-L-arabinose transferase-like glycosyltransferase
VVQDKIAPVATSDSDAVIRRWIEPLAIVVLALALNLAGNGRTSLWDRDEPRYAVCVREMRASQNWFFPTFNGEPRYHKPILIYWLMGLATAVWGDNPFGVRMVSSLAGAGTVLGVWVLGRRMLGPNGARLAALVMATSPLAVAESKLATTDATLALFLLGCQACLWELGRRPSRVAAGVFWGLMGLATLTKGPVGPALVAVSSILAWWWGFPAAAWKRLHWRRGLAGFALLTAPWFIVVAVASGGDYLRFALGKEIVHRVASDMEAHGGFPGYYAVIGTLAFYPWSALFPAAVLGAWLRRRSSPHFGFLLGWAIGPLVLLECFRTKLIHYYLPALPACALLVAWLIVSVTAEGVNIRRRPLGRLGMAILVAIGLASVALLVALSMVVRGGLFAPLLLVAAVLAAGTLRGLSWFQQGAIERAAYALAATWALVLVTFSGWLLPRAEPYRTSRIIGEKLAAFSAKLGIEPVLLEYQEPGVIYAAGRPIPLTRDRDGFFAHLSGGQSVLTIALQSEIDVMRSYFGLIVNPVDEVDGYVLTKGKHQTLKIAVVRQGDAPPQTPKPALDTRRVGLKLEHFERAH